MKRTVQPLNNEGANGQPSIIIRDAAVAGDDGMVKQGGWFLRHSFESSS